MNPFSSILDILRWIFHVFAYQPELNIMQALFDLTGDIGISIILLAIIVNIILWPLFSKFYLNSQKVRLLQPQMKQLQTKYKDEPQIYIKKVRAFQRKHGINNSLFFYFIVLQILLLSGVWTVTRDIGNNEIGASLYSFAFGEGAMPNFDTQAFGFLNISSPASEVLWLPAITMLLSALYGLYITKWAPKPPVLPTPKSKKKDSDTPELDPEMMNKVLQFQSVYMMPVFIFFINLNLNVGSNIYSLTLALIALARQVYLTQYYSTHIDALINDAAQSDPDIEDYDSSDVIDAAQQEVATLTVEAKKPQTTKKSKASKKSTSKSSKKKSTASKKKPTTKKKSTSKK